MSDVVKNGRKELSEKLNKTNRRSGIVLINSIPPFLNSNSIRRLLSKYGEIGRIYLTPEDKTKTKRRKKLKKIKRKKFENGWIEFADKNVAKNVANSLNKTKMGGSVKNKYREDLWNLKFLPGFKWHHLTEQIQYEQEIKELKMREAAREAEAEEKFYLKRVSQNNFLNKMAEENKEIDKTKNRIVNRTFRQKKIIDECADWEPTQDFDDFVTKLIG